MAKKKTTNKKTTEKPASKSLNSNLHKARKTKQDEFYTQLPDIEEELRHYEKHFKGKTVLCSCDDPRVSNFFKYFTINFHRLKLKKLITTCYKNNDSTLFSTNEGERGVWLEYTGDHNGNKEVDAEEVGIHEFNGDGDFRSDEAIELLKQADIVVTNPPFSLFREYIGQLMAYDKKFLIIGNHFAISYKGIFELIRDDKLWIGNSTPDAFRVPDHYEMVKNRSWRDDDGNNWRSLGNFCCWFTNLDIAKQYEDLLLSKTLTSMDYPTYDNYDAIEVSRVKNIPADYKGVMGVPITFLGKHNPKQFEIVGSNYIITQDPNGVYGRGSKLNGKRPLCVYLFVIES